MSESKTHIIFILILIISRIVLTIPPNPFRFTSVYLLHLSSLKSPRSSLQSMRQIRIHLPIHTSHIRPIIPTHNTLAFHLPLSITISISLDIRIPFPIPGSSHPDCGTYAVCVFVRVVAILVFVVVGVHVLVFTFRAVEVVGEAVVQLDKVCPQRSNSSFRPLVRLT